MAGRQREEEAARKEEEAKKLEDALWVEDTLLEALVAFRNSPPRLLW